MSDICHEMNEGEILNKAKIHYPLYKALLYGNRVDCAKLSKRLSCAVKYLPLRVQFSFEYDTQKAIDAGVRKSPTLVLDGVIFLEGLVQAEDMIQAFQKMSE